MGACHSLPCGTARCGGTGHCGGVLWVLVLVALRGVVVGCWYLFRDVGVFVFGGACVVGCKWGVRGCIRVHTGAGEVVCTSL